MKPFIDWYPMSIKIYARYVFYIFCYLYNKMQDAKDHITLGSWYYTRSYSSQPIINNSKNDICSKHAQKPYFHWYSVCNM